MNKIFHVITKIRLMIKVGNFVLASGGHPEAMGTSWMIHPGGGPVRPASSRQMER